MTDRVQSIERSIDILVTLAGGPRTVTEVARETKLSKATAYRLLASLAYRSLVIKDERANLYLLGPGFLRLLNGALQSFGSFAMLAQPSLKRLCEKTGETIVVHARIGRERVCLAQVPSASPVRFTIEVGSIAPLHVGSSGKVLLAFMEPAERLALVNSLQLTAVTDRTVTDRRKLIEELETINKQGFAWSEGERTPGAMGLSVPIRGRDGFLAALTMSGPTERAGRDRLDFFLPLLIKAAKEVDGILLKASYYTPSNGLTPTRGRTKH